MAQDKATVNVSKYNPVSGGYELQRTQHIPVQEAQQLEDYLANCLMIQEFYYYQIDYPDGRIIAKYTSYADALGIVRASGYCNTKMVAK